MKTRRTNHLTNKIAVLGLALVVGLGSMTIGAAAWTDEIWVNGTVTTGGWSTEQEGSPGFWKNAQKTGKYTPQQLLDFCASVDAASQWLVPDVAVHFGLVDWADVEKIFDDGEGPDTEKQFLRQYMALRLNAVSGRLFLTTTHNIFSYDSGNYLGLTPLPTSPPPNLQQVLNAIEIKFGTSPTKAQYTIMKNLCEALNVLLV